MAETLSSLQDLKSAGGETQPAAPDPCPEAR